MQTIQQRLVVITGPVGAGKSTTSAAMAQALRRFNLSVAVVDLDLMYGFVRQQAGYGEPTAWARVRQGAAGLATALFITDMSLVIVEGEFFTADQLNTLLASIPPNIQSHFFTLQLSYTYALDRVQGDPLRGASKNPAFLRSLHATFVQALPFLEATSVVINTDGLTQDAVVERLVEVMEES